MVSPRSCCLELLFVQGGLDGGRGIPDGCWWVVRVAAEVFDELLCVLARLMRVYLSNFFFSSRLATKPGRELAAKKSPALEENGVTTAVSM